MQRAAGAADVGSWRDAIHREVTVSGRAVASAARPSGRSAGARPEARRALEHAAGELVEVGVGVAVAPAGFQDLGAHHAVEALGSHAGAVAVEVELTLA